MAEAKTAICSTPSPVKSPLARTVRKYAALAALGRKDRTPVKMVQFHPSYSYEDFVQGWRPTSSGGFSLRNGEIYELLCQRAELSSCLTRHR
jgi:hypothetical protein